MQVLASRYELLRSVLVLWVARFRENLSHAERRLERIVLQEAEQDVNVVPVIVQGRAGQHEAGLETLAEGFHCGERVAVGVLDGMGFVQYSTV